MTEDQTLSNVLAGVRAAVDRRGAQPVVLDVRRLSGVTDYYVIVSGSSDRRVQAIAEGVLEALGERGVRPLGVEGIAEGRWALVDYGDWVLHVFYEELRGYYDLEGLWFDAPRVELPADTPESSPAHPAVRAQS
ncbi:MAG: ribosome silencing factor [Deltaproteobacteria bacterium]|nr:ribosome silencing factor [Deltaproteobacteria bacterium]